MLWLLSLLLCCLWTLLIFGSGIENFYLSINHHHPSTLFLLFSLFSSYVFDIMQDTNYRCRAPQSSDPLLHQQTRSCIVWSTCKRKPDLAGGLMPKAPVKPTTNSWESPVNCLWYNMPCETCAIQPFVQQRLYIRWKHPMEYKYISRDAAAHNIVRLSWIPLASWRKPRHDEFGARFELLF